MSTTANLAMLSLTWSAYTYSQVKHDIMVNNKYNFPIISVTQDECLSLHPAGGDLAAIQEPEGLTGGVSTIGLAGAQVSHHCLVSW